MLMEVKRLADAQRWRVRVSERHSTIPISELPTLGWERAIAASRQAAHCQIDICPRQSTRLVGSNEGRYVCHLVEGQDSFRLGRACEIPCEMFKGHTRWFALELENFFHRACLRDAVDRPRAGPDVRIRVTSPAF